MASNVIIRAIQCIRHGYWSKPWCSTCEFYRICKLIAEGSVS